MQEPSDHTDPARGAELATLLVGAVRGISSTFTARMAAAGFSDVRPTHGFALTLIGDNGTTATELGRRLGMTKQSAGEVVTHLARQGYVDRTPDPADRRARLITLTDRGQDCAKIIWVELAAFEDTWRAAVGDEQLAGIKTGLRSGLKTMREGVPEGMSQAWFWSA